MLQAVEKAGGAGGKLTIQKTQMLKWIESAWKEVSPDVIRESFHCCGITSKDPDVINCTKLRDGKALASEARESLLKRALDVDSADLDLNNLRIDDDGISLFGIDEDENNLRGTNEFMDLDA
jgi:hypothetical protein